MVVLRTSRKGLIVIVLVACVAIAVGAFAFQQRGPSYETIAVARGHLIEEVFASGRVESKQGVALGFTGVGNVASVLIEPGDLVSRGDPLVRLAIGTLAETLAQAEAEVALRLADTGNIETNIENVRREQDEAVASARRAMLSAGLEAVPVSAQYTARPPVITGSYDGPEGTYRLAVRSAPGGFNYFMLHTFELERTEPVRILDTEPTPLGTRGLFVSFPDDIVQYGDTIWEVTIPNTRHPGSAAARSAYEQALATRDRIVAEAEAALAERGQGETVAGAQLAAARAEVSRIEREIADRTLAAPFDGIVTRVDARVGETLTGGSPVVSLMPEGMLQVTVNVSENNIIHVAPGQKASIMLDAFRGDIWEGEVARIDPAESIVGGAVYYKTVILFSETDERVRSGMTANVWIKTDERDNALYVPAGAVAREDGREIVRVLPAGAVEPVVREIVTGIRSGDGMVELLSGVSEGERIVIGAR